MSMDFGKLNFSTSFKPTSAFPLNANCYFESYAQAVAAASTAEEVGSSNTVYYYGQEIVVVENNVAKLYVIQPDKTLKEVTISADDNSITIENGVVKITGIDSAEAGAQLVVKTAEDGITKEVSWVKPDTTTVEGIQTAIADLQENKADKSDITNVYKYKGSVNTYAELPTEDLAIGYVYNVVTADKDHDIKAGDNLAWNGTEWDNLGGTVDLTAYSTTEQITELLNKKVDVVEGSRLMTNAEGTKLAGIAEGANVNVIDSVDSQFSIDENKKLSLNDIAMSKVTGLSDALAGKMNTGDADKNILESIKINGTALTITDKAVNIPIATAEALGVIKSSTGDNKVTVGADGIATVSTVNANTLTQTEGEYLILNGGSSSN